ncbi:MAG: glycosyltransferase family 87 protein, partial [Planctomycetia bacterium]
AAASDDEPPAPGVDFAAAVFSVALVGPWIIRDLDDCGMHTFLLYGLSAGVLTLLAGRGAQAGVWFGTAIVYKASPLLFLPVLVGLRRWKTLAFTTVAAVALCLSPAAFVGWDRMVEMNRLFVVSTLSVGAQANPSENGYETPRHQNQGLTPTVARYTMTFPPGHPLYIDHPAFLQFAALPPATAALVAKGASVLCLLVVAACLLRKQWIGVAPPAYAPELAAVCLLCSVLSPICWTQHFVLCLPAVYLVVRRITVLHAARRPLPWTLVAAVGFMVFVQYGLSRELLQRELSVVALSYKLQTLAVLAAFAAVLTLPTRRISASAAKPVGREPPRVLRAA